MPSWGPTDGRDRTGRERLPHRQDERLRAVPREPQAGALGRPGHPGIARGFYQRAGYEGDHQPGPSLNWRALPGGEDWLLRPVLAGHCRLESLKDGTLDMADVALLNDALDVKADNERLWNEYLERQRDGR